MEMLMFAYIKAYARVLYQVQELVAEAVSRGVLIALQLRFSPSDYAPNTSAMEMNYNYTKQKSLHLQAGEKNKEITATKDKL